MVTLFISVVEFVDTSNHATNERIKEMTKRNRLEEKSLVKNPFLFFFILLLLSLVEKSAKQTGSIFIISVNDQFDQPVI